MGLRLRLLTVLRVALAPPLLVALALDAPGAVTPPAGAVRPALTLANCAVWQFSPNGRALLVQSNSQPHGITLYTGANWHHVQASVRAATLSFAWCDDSSHFLALTPSAILVFDSLGGRVSSTRRVATSDSQVMAVHGTGGREWVVVTGRRTSFVRWSGRGVFLLDSTPLVSSRGPLDMLDLIAVRDGWILARASDSDYWEFRKGGECRRLTSSKTHAANEDVRRDPRRRPLGRFGIDLVDEIYDSRTETTAAGDMVVFLVNEVHQQSEPSSPLAVGIARRFKLNSFRPLAIPVPFDAGTKAQIVGRTLWVQRPGGGRSVSLFRISIPQES